MVVPVISSGPVQGLWLAGVSVSWVQLGKVFFTVKLLVLLISIDKTSVSLGLAMD